MIDQHQAKMGNDKGNPLTIHFVEDRFETLLTVMRTPELEGVKLYLVGE